MGIVFQYKLLQEMERLLVIDLLSYLKKNKKFAIYVLKSKVPEHRPPIYVA